MHNTRIYRELGFIALLGLIAIVVVTAALGSTSINVAPANITALNITNDYQGNNAEGVNRSAINPAQFFFTATVIWLFVCWQAWKRAHLNRPALDAPHYANLGSANALSLLRGGFIALTGGFLFQPTPTDFLLWVPGVLYGIAALLDRVDGYIARRSGTTSILGSELDTAFDALGLLVAPLLAIQFGKLEPSFIAVSLAYYLFIAGIYWRQKTSLAVYPLMPSQLRRAFAGFQMGFVALVMLPLFPADATRLLGIAFMLPILAGFVFDWLVVSGRINGEDKKTHLLLTQLDATSRLLIQPALRIITAVLVFSLITVDTQLTVMDTSTLVALAVLILVGAGARIASFLLILFCAYLMNTHGEWYQLLILFVSSWLLLLGPGNYVVWRGDDIWINRQDGA
jgi:CDP-diacylglycerol--glycerol-3-phosphate 3-phosphatidyltransferase